MSRVWLAAPAMLVFASMLLSVSGFGSNEDKFIKRYAMMKIYESCFGPEVVKQVRKEMKAACAKCATYEQPQPTAQALPRPPPPPHGSYDNREPQIPPQIADPENTMYANQQTIDPEKLQQAILSYRPLNNPFAAAAQYRPYQQPNYFGGYPQAPVAVPYVYPGYQPQAFPSQSYSSFPYFGPQYYSSNRVSRDMDIRNQLDAITSRTSGKVRNVTCVMQELGYLDENLEPNFEKISERIGNLPVSDELKRDMQDGVVFCQQFSQCIPDVKERSPLSRELVRPMFFFKCYKHKKLEACIMKDVREKYAGVADEDFDGDGVEFRRTGRATKETPDEVDQLASSIYEFLYGSDHTVDIDSVL
ncbi:LOW QUALITY PROTEIN: uncharacterized protein [Atheta coriaria]|uniref:LOW QUALITY PROTEIN: uncharacterized protein n=1 Tax=Dalotia coriaria TaxID=877792 RepID=UPI0031F44551